MEFDATQLQQILSVPHTWPLDSGSTMWFPEYLQFSFPENILLYNFLSCFKHELYVGILKIAHAVYVISATEG